MQKSRGAIWAVFTAALFAVSVPAYSQNSQSQAQDAAERRELIFCADLMTHEEREAYRASMRAARTREEKATLRDAHRQEMQMRARQRGAEGQCEPLRQRARGGHGQ